MEFFFLNDNRDNDNHDKCDFFLFFFGDFL